MTPDPTSPFGDENALADVLLATPLCRDLTRDEVLRIVQEGRVERWPAGATVMEEGSAGPRLVILLEGRVAILKSDDQGGQHLLVELGPGSVLGEVSLLLESTRTATARALEPLRVFAMERAGFQAMIDEGDPAALKMGFALARALAGRLLSVNDRVIELLSEVSDQRRRVDFLRANGEIERRWDF